MITRGALLALLFFAGCDGCSRRRPIPVGPDTGPAVELVDRGPAVELVSQPLTEEHEPDDDRDHAQPLEPGKGVRGSLLPPGSGGAGKGDDDWYSYLVQAPAGAPPEPLPQELRIELVPGRGADLSLELLDGDGRRMVLLDERPAGEPERLAGLVARLGQTLYLRVRPSPRQRAAPGREDATYQLLLAQAPAPAGSEVEPNDAPAQAQPAEGRHLSGVLAWRKDEDWFAVPLLEADGGAPPDAQVAPGAILRLELRAPGLQAALRLATPGRPPFLEVRDGEELRLRNVGLPPGATQLLLGVRASAARRGADGRYQLLLGVEPPLEGAEREPNDRCTEATPLPGGPAGEIAGFLWPGDEDCYRLALQAPARVTFRLAQAEECQAQLALPGETQGRAEITDLPRSGEALVRVIGRPRRGCFDAPYRLQFQVAPGP